MNSNRRISLAAMFLAGSALAASPSLAEQGFHPAAHPHPVAHPAAAHPALHRPVPRGTYRVIRPGAGFHRAPGFAVRAHPFHSIIARHVPFARFSRSERALWARGRWQHRWWHGRYGWWWYTGGAWFWYAAPVYPYPTVVSDYYYEEPDAEETGPTWWYCYHPAGYYPYVRSCHGPWTPVPAQGYGSGYGDEQSGPDQGPPPGDDYRNEQGPPPSSRDSEQGPPPGYDQGPPPGSEQGPPSGYDQGPPPGSEQGPPSGYDQGPPSGYDQGPPPDSEGPPPDNSRYPHNSH
jgi:hypothetical protein